MPATKSDADYRFYLDEDLKRDAQIEAVKAGLPLSEVLRRLLAAWTRGNVQLPKE